MQEIVIKIEKFTKGKTAMVDEHPIVNDKDYVDVITTPNTLHYSYNGCKCGVSGILNKEELVKQAINDTLFDEFYENHYGEKFADIGLPAPKVYDFEEDAVNEVNSICDYIDNCKFDDNYSSIVAELIKISKNEIKIIVKDVS